MGHNPITRTDLRAALAPYVKAHVLPSSAGLEVDEAFLHPFGIMAFVHQSADAVDNQDMPAVVGDSLGRTAVLLRYIDEYPEEKGRYAVHKVAEAVMCNETLEKMLELLGLHNRMVYGESYQHVQMNRSSHGQGTVMEALLYAFYKRYDVETSFRFLNRVLDEYLRREGLTLGTLELQNPIGRLYELVAQHVGPGDKHVEYQIEQQGPQSFMGSACVVGAPHQLNVAGLKGPTKRKVKKSLAMALLANEDLVAWVKAQHKVV